MLNALTYEVIDSLYYRYYICGGLGGFFNQLSADEFITHAAAKRRAYDALMAYMDEKDFMMAGKLMKSLQIGGSYR